MVRKFVLCVAVYIGVLSIIPLGFRIPSVKGVVPVEGHITSDAIWTPIDIYRVINNTYVDSGVTLSIKPGVQVHFEDNVSLIIEGTLNASGTEPDPILFTSSRVADNPSDPYPGAWNTTRFNGNTSEQFILKNVKVEYAVHGVTIESLAVAIIEKSKLQNCSESGIKLIGESNVIIRENLIVKNKYGITTDYAGVHAGIMVDGNEIFNNTGSGVYLYSYNYRADACICNITFSSNNIQYNGRYGIYCHTDAVMPWTGYPNGLSSLIHNILISSNIIKANGRGGICLKTVFSGTDGSYGYGYICDVSFSSNTISKNSENGVELYSDCWRGKSCIYDVSFSSNTITSNGQSGLYLYCDSMIDIRIHNVNLSSNTISENCTNGVYAKAPTRCIGQLECDLSVSNNMISANNDAGIYLYGSSNNSIFGNNIADNDYGIWLEYSSDNKIYDNIFVNNSENVHLGTSSSADFGDDDGCLRLTCIVIVITIIAGAIGVLLVYFTKVKKTEKIKQ